MFPNANSTIDLIIDLIIDFYLNKNTITTFFSNIINLYAIYCCQILF